MKSYLTIFFVEIYSFILSAAAAADIIIATYNPMIQSNSSLK